MTKAKKPSARVRQWNHLAFLVNFARNNFPEFAVACGLDPVLEYPVYLDRMVRHFAAAANVPVGESKRDLTAQQLGAIRVELRRQMEASGIQIPASGRKRPKPEADADVLLGLLAEWRSQPGYTVEGERRLVRRQTGRDQVDFDDPAAVGKVLGALRSILRRKKRKAA